jgi:WS/DGAT/MGAT family acyltransferase
MVAAYERLSSLDQTFLSFETGTTHMHIALTAIFEAGPLGARGGVDIDRIRRHIAARLHLIPRYRQRLAYVPVLRDPVWIDDDRFDLDYHVRHASLPHPWGDVELRQRCEEILERPLDRDRPLWEIWIIEGLTRRRFAMLTKVHHCLVDGIGGVGILTTLLSLDAETANDPAPSWKARAIPSAGEMLGREVVRRGRALVQVGREVGRLSRDPAALASSVRRRVTAVWSLLATGLRATPRTPLNCTVGAHRRIDWRSLDLGEVKAVKNALGGTVNDVVLATVAGGLRRFLLARRDGAGLEDFKVAVPVNVRDSNDGRPGNRASIWMLTLPLGESDALQRLHAIRATTEEMKTNDRAQGAAVLTEAAEWAGAGVVHLAVRLIALASPYNLIVTNVPGPSVPLYLLGARMLDAYPYLPLFQSQGLGVALFSHGSRLNWGLTGDWDGLPDVAELGRAFEETFWELRNLATAKTTERPARPSPPPAREPATRRDTPRPAAAALHHHH